MCEIDTAIISGASRCGSVGSAPLLHSPPPQIASPSALCQCARSSAVMNMSKKIGAPFYAAARRSRTSRNRQGWATARLRPEDEMLTLAPTVKKPPASLSTSGPHADLDKLYVLRVLTQHTTAQLHAPPASRGVFYRSSSELPSHLLQWKLIMSRFTPRSSLLHSNLERSLVTSLGLALSTVLWLETVLSSIELPEAWGRKAQRCRVSLAEQAEKYVLQSRPGNKGRYFWFH